MELGVALRSMGREATRETLLACARAAEEAGLDALWIPDHIAIPPEESSGSEGRYLDPLASLAFLAAATRRIGLGTAVLVLPYRPALPTAKWLATLQELSGGRLRLGVGVGWMHAEFRALGVARERRGLLTDQTLDFLRRCFGNDEVEAHGQRFLFRPRPMRPPIFVGGAPPHALRRAVRFAEGWMPMTGDPEKLREPVAELRRLAREAGRPAPEVVAMTGLPLSEPNQARDRIAALAEVGVTRLIHAFRYADAGVFARQVEALSGCVPASLREA